jgi:hypothetical protein
MNARLAGVTTTLLAASVAASWGMQQPAPPKPLVRMWSPDPEVVPPLPILSPLREERLGTTDPTVEISTKLAGSTVLPTRSKPQPLAPLASDPFENRRVVKLGKAVPEDLTPRPAPVPRP